MQQTTFLFVGIGMVFVGSLLIAETNILLHFGGIVLGGIGALCVIIYLLKHERKRCFSLLSQ